MLSTKIRHFIPELLLKLKISILFLTLAYFKTIINGYSKKLYKSHLFYWELWGLLLVLQIM